MRKRKHHKGRPQSLLILIFLLVSTAVIASSFYRQVLFRYTTRAQSAATTPRVDINLDGVANILDYVILFENISKQPITDPRADINEDGAVNILDYVLLFENFGRTVNHTAPTATPTQGTSNQPTHETVRAWIDAYKSAHPGKAGDITDKTPAQLAADADAQRLASVCGPDQRAVIPLLSWEYGGNDHPWISPSASALVYCVYIPVSSATEHWKYDAAQDRVTADVSVLFPAQNPCKDRSGKDQIIGCLGDPSNSEILVDTASLHDGIHAPGLPTLANASTVLNLILPDGTKTFLLLNL